MKQEPGPTERAFNALAESLSTHDLDLQARIAAARVVAQQLDQASGGETTAKLARELRLALDDLKSMRQDSEWDALVQQLVATDA